MRACFPVLLILLIGLAPFGALATILVNGSVPLSFDSGSTIGTVDGALEKGMQHIPVPGPDLGQANWSSNHFENPGFESWSSAYDCARWTESKTGDRHHWIETSQVNEGLYSAGLQCQNYPNEIDRARIEQSGINADFSNITFSFDWYLDQNEYPIRDVMYTRVQLRDGPTQYWLYYFLNGSSQIDQNTTWEGYFIFDMGPAHQWNSLSRNLTADFLSVPELQGSYSENLVVDEIKFELETYAGTSTLLRGFIDNVQLLNETDNYYWINGTNRNGNFETGDFTSWSTLGSTDAGQIERSLTAYEGSYSANLTAYSNGNFSEATTRDYPYTRLTSLNQGHVKIWWNLTFQNLTADTYAYILFKAYDGFDERDVYYMLGYGGTTSPIANSSDTVVLKPDNFNTTGSWNLLDVNLWTDASSHFSLNELMVNYVQVVVRAEGTDALMSMLIDSVNLRAASLNHADFEDQPAVGQRIQGFILTSPLLTVTSAAYGGSKAGNLTQTSGSLTLTHPLQMRPLNSTRETYLDAMWRIEETITANQVWFRLTFTDGRELIYYMNGLTIGPVNDSTYGYFNVTGAGTTGVWMQMHRDLTHDYEAVFGVLPDTTMETLYLRTSTSGRLEILFDDFYLYDDPAPRIIYVTHDPANPGINQPVNVTADVVEQDLTLVELDYRVYTGTWSGWTNIEMDHLTGDTYNATIPGQISGAVVEYNISATDSWGMTTISLDNGNPWSYTVADVNPPNINSVDHDPTTVRYSNTVDVTANVTDDGLIASVKLFYTTNSWTTSDNLTMVLTTGDLYVATIPAMSYGITIEYYVNATDSADNWTVDNNSGSYYSYTVIDDIDPVIQNVGHSPDPVGYTDSPLVECDVSDPGSFLASVMLYYRFDLGTWIQQVMTNATGHYSYNIPTQPTGTFVEYFINATDNADNWAVSSTGSYTVVDTIPPEITGVTQTPTTVEYDDSPLIECDVSDTESFIASVVLYYRFDLGTWTTQVMTNTTGHYSYNIPTQPTGTFVQYYINATDNADNWAVSSTGSYTVVDNTPPEITGVTQTPLTVEYDDNPLIECDVNDLGSFISSVVLYYRFNLGTWISQVMTNTTGHYTYNIPAQVTGTFVEYYVNATDNAGNWAASSTGNYTVVDNTPPEITGETRTPFTVEYDDSPLIECDISDSGSFLALVVLYYRFDLGTWTTQVMTNTTGHYSYNIPTQPTGTFVQYYINATDNADNWAVSSTGSYTVVDNTPPEITGVTQTPLTVEYDDNPLIECDVSDPGSFLASVVLYYQLDSSGTWIQQTMTNATGHYSYNIPAQITGTFVEYYINATDNADNWAVSSTDSYTVQDNTPPEITDITRTPSVVIPSDTPLVGCNVSDAGTSVSTVELYYTPDGWTNTYVISMSFVSGDHYEATLPTYPYDTLVQYYINATDIEDNIGLSGIISYTVGDDIPPEISNVSHSPDPVEYSDDITVSCDATDVGSGIDTVTLYYRMNGGSWQSMVMSPTIGDRYEATLSALTWNTLVEYYVNATDNSGHEVRDDNGGSYYSFTVLDLTDPIIANIIQTPASVNYSVSPTIDCDTSDPGSGISAVRLYYRLDGGTWFVLLMMNTVGIQYQANIPTQTWNTFVEYYVNATDNAGNWAVDDNAGAYYSYTVSDTISPVIVNIDPAPASVEYSDTPTIGCDVTDVGSGIQNVVLNYSVDGGSWMTLTMSFVSGTLYQVNLPTQAWGAQVTYYVNVTDNAGNWIVDDNSGSYYSYTVIDSTDPDLEITNPTDGEEVSGVTTIAVTSTDLGSGITSVRIFIDGTEVTELTSAPFTYAWNTTLVLDGAHDISVTAYDNAGNEVTVTISVTVNNAPTFTPQIPAEIIIAGIVIIAVVAFAGIIMFRRRRRWGD